MTKNRALFLDRDGVINKDFGYVYKIEDFEFLPKAKDAIRLFSENGYLVIIVTNQSGIARGYYTEKDFGLITDYIDQEVEKAAGHITDTFFCPHFPEGTIEYYSIACDCRKPAAGMIIKATAKHFIDLGKSIMIGDKITDIKAANDAGVGDAYLITTESKTFSVPELDSVNATKMFPSLWECALHLTSLSSRR
jgi:D-glycero-D-manno-heptose 1,7-bisphosphate phosphatase